MAPLGIHQQVFALSMFSNALGSLTGTEKALQGIFEERLQESLSTFGLNSWKVAWGPRVWKEFPDISLGAADNTWFIVRNPNAVIDGQTQDTYVVSMAGTLSDFDYLVEDLLVNNVVDVAGWIKAGLNTRPVAATDVHDNSNAFISIGTAIGLFTLLNQQSGTSQGAGTTIVQYLRTLPSTARVIFTGHSLGGALSPSLAVLLIQAGVLNATSVLTYPTAGPSPGNARFASLFQTLLPMKYHPGSPAYETWNSDLFNELDIVPLAWSLTDPTRNIPKMITIYGKLPFFLSLIIRAMVAIVTDIVDQAGIQYQPLQGRSWGGGALPKPKPQSRDDFNADAGFEHIQAYMDFIKVQIPTEVVFPPEAVAKYGVQPKTEQERTVALPLLNILHKTRLE